MRTRLLPIAAAILVLCCTSAALADPAPVYFNLPAGYNAGMGIAPAPDGTVWFVANPGTPHPSIGRLITSQASPGTTNGMATFPTPTQAGTGCCANAVRSVAYDAASNRLWFVQNDGIVGFANPAAVSPGTSNGIIDTLVQTSTTSGPFSPDLWDIAVGADGLAWFSEMSTTNAAPYPGDRIASIDAGLHVTEQGNLALQGGLSSLDSTRYDAQPEGIATDPAGKPWFAEANPGLPGYRVATTNGVGGYPEYLITPCAGGSPCSGSNTGTGPTDVAVAHDGSIWFTNELKNEVGRLDSVGGTFTHYSLPAIDAGLAGGQARAITVAPDGTLWVAEYGGYSLPNANAIVKIVPTATPTATVTHLGATGYPLAVAPDAKGNVWFSLATATAPGLIGELTGVVVVGAGGGGGGGGGGGVVIKPAAVGVARVGTPSTNGSSVSVDQICVGPPSDPCSLVYIVSSGDYVDGFPHTKAASVTAAAAKAKPKTKRKPRKPKPVVLGRKAITLHGGQHKRITITLNAKGRALLKHAKGGKLTLYFTAEQAGAKGKPAKRLKRIRVTFRLKHAKHVKRRR